jgi:hypothetical protein
MSTDTKFAFSIEPKPAFTRIDITKNNFADVAFTVTNQSGRPVRAEAMVIPLEGAKNAEGEALPPEEWGHWLTVLEEPAYDFDASSIKNYTVRIQLPADLRFGEYRFQLAMVGVDDPDTEYTAGDVVTFSTIGPQLNLRNFILIALAIVVALTLLGVLTAVLFQEDRLMVTLDAPAGPIRLGETATYQLEIRNTNSVTATDVLLLYHPAPGVVGATAFTPNAQVRQCDEIGGDQLEMIQCDLGSLPPEEALAIRLEVIPAPTANVLTNTTVVTILARLDGVLSETPAEVEQETTPLEAGDLVALVIDPSAAVATVDEPITYRLLAWTNGLSTTQQLTLTYTLPQGMRYVEISGQGILLPEGCQQQESYFTLVCGRAYDPTSGKPAEVAVRVVPSEVSAQLPEHQATVQLSSPAEPDLDTRPGPLATTTFVVNSSLYFDGLNDYVNLGYAETPPSENLSLEFWVHPFSTDDGQSFVGVHREEADNLNNLLLVGYWNDGLNVNVGAAAHVITGTKRTERYHLAVTVERRDAESSYVTVYINGEPQAWRDPDLPLANPCGQQCKVFTDTLGSGATSPWVLGQEWDRGSPEPRASDFFQGSMSEVRLWETVRNRDEILANMDRHLRGDEPGLLGYWRLEPDDPTSDRVLDHTPHAYHGKRLGAAWGASVRRFGEALQLDGIDDRIEGPSLPAAPSLAGQPDELAVTVAGWFFVDRVPTEQEWLVVVPVSAPVAGPTVVVAGAEQTVTNTLPSEQAIAPPPDGAADQSADLTTEAPIAATTSPSQTIWIALVLDNDGHVAIVTRTPNQSSTSEFQKDERAITVGAWVHYAGVVQIRSVSTAPQVQTLLYRNGARVKLNTPIAFDDLGCTPRVYIGGACLPNLASALAGRLDEVRIWQRALSEAEINNWLNRPGEVFDEAAYWPFDDGPGPQSADRSRRGHTLRLNGPAWIASTIGIDQATE